jgi:hypothetical protein
MATVLKQPCVHVVGKHLAVLALVRHLFAVESPAHIFMFGTGKPFWVGMEHPAEHKEHAGLIRHKGQCGASCIVTEKNVIAPVGYLMPLCDADLGTIQTDIELLGVSGILVQWVVVSERDPVIVGLKATTLCLVISVSLCHEERKGKRTPYMKDPCLYPLGPDDLGTAIIDCDRGSVCSAYCVWCDPWFSCCVPASRAGAALEPPRVYSLQHYPSCREKRRDVALLLLEAGSTRTV